MPYPTVIPAGSQPPPMEEQPGPVLIPDGHAPAQSEANPAPAEGEGESPKYAGKYDTPEELAKAYQELSALHGRHSAEIGDLRKANSVLLNQLEHNQQSSSSKGDGGKSAPEAPPDYDGQLADITRQVSEGEIDMAEALLLTSKVTAEKTLAMAEANFESREKNSKIKSVQDQFMKDHPDYAQLRDSGALDQLMQDNPLHDRFSAYFALKASEASSQVEQAAADAYNKGKAEVQKIADGTKIAEKVLAGPGATVRQASQPAGMPTNSQIRESMHATLAKVRGG